MMDFSYSDLYPNMSSAQEETSTEVSLEENDKDAMNDEVEVTESKGSSPKSIFLAIGVAVAMVVFLGVGGANRG